MTAPLFRRWLKAVVFPPVRTDTRKFAQRFSGRNVVVIGASSGIGYALSRMLIATGAHVFLVARSELPLKTLCQEADERGGNAEYMLADLRDDNQLTALCERLKSRFDRLDALFYNAGKSIRRSLAASTDRLHDFDRTLSVNYRGLVAVALALHAALEKGRGAVVYSSSVSTLFPLPPGWAAYHASKQAANAWCETARAEWKGSGICVKTAYLPLVHTPMSAVNERYRHWQAYSAEEAATILLRLATGDRQTYRPWWAWLLAPVAKAASPLLHILYHRLA